MVIFTQDFGRCILWPSPGVSCRTQAKSITSDGVNPPNQALLGVGTTPWDQAFNFSLIWSECARLESILGPRSLPSANRERVIARIRSCRGRKCICPQGQESGIV